MWHPKRGGGIYADHKVADFMTGACLEIKQQLGKYETLLGPVKLEVCFLTESSDIISKRLRRQFAQMALR